LLGTKPCFFQGDAQGNRYETYSENSCRLQQTRITAGRYNTKAGVPAASVRHVTGTLMAGGGVPVAANSSIVNGIGVSAAPCGVEDDPLARRYRCHAKLFSVPRRQSPIKENKKVRNIFFTNICVL